MRKQEKVKKKKKRMTKVEPIPPPSLQAGLRPRMEERGKGSIKKCHKEQHLKRATQEKATLQKSTVVQSVPNLTQAHRWHPALLLPRRVLSAVNRQLAKVMKMEAQRLSAHVVLTVTLPLHVNGVTTARTLASQVAHIVVPLAGETAIIGVTEVKHLVAGHIQVALSAPRQEAVLTATTAAAIQTAIVTTAMESIAGQKDGLRTPSTIGEVVDDHIDGIIPPPLLKTTRVRDHARIAAESTIDGGVIAAVAGVTVVAAGAAAPAHTDAAVTAAAAALPVARPAPPKAQHTGTVTTDERIALHVDVILIALVSTDHSLRGLPRPVHRHEPATRLKLLKEVGQEQALQNIGTL